jgi:hypothetical protein
LGGPQIMNIYYAAIYTFFLVIGIWMTMSARDNYQ